MDAISERDRVGQYILQNGPPWQPESEHRRTTFYGG